MYLQEILEIAIGLVLVWLVVSVATMSLQEWMENILNLRAKDLEKGITRMLISKDLSRSFYEFPLIASLYPKPNKPGQKGRLPSYIPADKFGATLFELIIRAGTDNSPVQMMTSKIESQLAAIKSPEQLGLARQDWEAILETAKNLVASGLGSAALDSLKFQIQSYGEKHPDLESIIDQLLPQVETYYGQFVEEQHNTVASGADNGLAMRQFRLGMLAMEKINPRLNTSLTALLRPAESDAQQIVQEVATARSKLETWFNDAMDRISGTYKRRAQLVAFLIGSILAVTLNIDSINTANSLWREPTLRQAIVAQAQNYSIPANCQGVTAAGPLQNIPALETQLQALNLPFGWTIVPSNPGGSQCSLIPTKAGQIWGIPSLNYQAQPTCNAIKNLPTDLDSWLLKILGLLITGLAATQGAPFWFDTLKKIINIRGTGANPIEKKTTA